LDFVGFELNFQVFISTELFTCFKVVTMHEFSYDYGLYYLVNICKYLNAGTYCFHVVRHQTGFYFY